MCPILRLAPPSSRTPAISYSLLTWCRQPTCITSQPLAASIQNFNDVKSILASRPGGLKTRCYTTSVVGFPHLDFGYDSPLHPPLFGLTHQSIRTSSILPRLRTRFSTFHGGRLVIQRGTVLNIPPYTSRHHISSSLAPIIYSIVQQSFLLLLLLLCLRGLRSGLGVFGLGKGQRQAYQESSGAAFLIGV